MTLGPCPSCSRHLHLPSATCPFCGEPAARAVSGALRPVTRRELTRAAIFGGAALLVAACGGSETTDEPPADEDPAGGGEDPEVVDPVVADEEVRDDQVRDDRVSDDEVVIPPEDDDPRRHRVLPACVTDGTCPAPPYGAPPADATLV